MQPFSFFFCYSLWGGGGGGISGRVRALNLTVPLGSGRVGSDDLGYGPGSGFSFEPVQTSSVRAHVCEGGGERESVCVCVWEVTQPRLVYCKLEYFSSTLCICSHFSHPNFTNCKLHTRVLTDADLWQVRVSPIDSGITHKVKKTRVSGPPWRPLLQIHTCIITVSVTRLCSSFGLELMVNTD